ncbi:unnamed protein product [Meloidogyne enterolobii]|uniref:Uncharacterized protein n=1 Tax=Meloidogyne enterolobii TaxID=390850 RepID=A0ACB1AN73_MELEN
MANKPISVLLILFLSVPQFNADQGNEEDPEEKSRYQQYVNEQNYHIPFKTRISEPFREYQTVHAVGKVNADPRRVDLNFYKGGNENDDMPLHLSVRFDEGLFKGNVVFNTLVNKNWSEPEERVQSPFKPDDEFDIRVFGNRIEMGTFDQRIPLYGVNHVSLLGDLKSLRVFHYGGTKFPNPYNAIAKLLPGNRVNFNLYKTNNDIALHISIRYSEGIIVRNSMISNQWGDQEIEGSLPLAKNEIFDLTIINEQANFLILFNGKKFCNFVHRSQNFDIETLEVDGTFELHTVTINNAR